MKCNKCGEEVFGGKAIDVSDLYEPEKEPTIEEKYEKALALIHELVVASDAMVEEFNRMWRETEFTAKSEPVRKYWKVRERAEQETEQKER